MCIAVQFTQCVTLFIEILNYMFCLVHCVDSYIDEYSIL